MKELALPREVALVGAFERDNFGDVLFLQLTRELLTASRTRISAPFGAQQGYLPLGMPVEHLRNVLSDRPDAVWMVGGEAGGTSMQDAFRMAAGESDYSDYTKMSATQQRRQLADLTGRTYWGSPYLPRMSAADETLSSRFVINSGGLSGLNGLIGHRSDEAWGAIRDAQFISVRDRKSSEVLSARGVEHVMAPDFVHTIRSSREDWIEGERAPYALVQVKSATLSRIGTRNFAALLLDCPELRSLEIRLFMAGSARGHDSEDLYLEVLDAAKEIDQGRTIGLSESRDPIAKAREIAHASIWIGTSLHGLIISSSFEVPRVGLELEKLVRYARTWGDPMPVGVSVGNLDDAARVALATKEVPGRADELSQRAASSAAGASEAADTPLTTDQVLARARRREVQTRRSKSLARSWATMGAEQIRARKG